MKRALPVGAVAFVLLAGGVAAFTLRSAERSSRVGSIDVRVTDSSAAPGVVLVCLDTLRADSLALDSGRPVRMPRLEAFARESVAFADAVAPSGWTGPSITSLLTGLDPAHSGVVGLPERAGSLPRSVTTLPERFAEAGWHTAAVTTGAWIVPGTSALRGTHVGAVGLDQDPDRVLRTWNARRPAGAPFFLFLHSLAAHDPYLDKPSDPWRVLTATVDETRATDLRRAIERGTDVSDADMRWAAELSIASGATRDRLGALLGRTAHDTFFGMMQRWLDDGAERDPRLAETGERLRAAYEKSLSDVDRLVGRILDGLAALELPVGTVIVVVADHGESFGEHGTLLHGRRLHDELLRVPLLVRAGGRMGPPRVIHGAAGLVDVVPTILELAGRPVPIGLDGISLVAPSVSPEGLVDRALFAYDERRRFDGGRESVEMLEGIRTIRAKCLVRRDASTRRLLGAVVFDLLVDPREEHPIPLDAVDRPCEFGDAFVNGLKDRGFVMPCLEAGGIRPSTMTGG